jgi:hypothetical protein
VKGQQAPRKATGQHGATNAAVGHDASKNGAAAASNSPSKTVGSTAASSSGGYAPGWLPVVLAIVLGIAVLLRWAFAKSGTDSRQKDVMATLIVVYLTGLALTAFLPLQPTGS